MKIILLRTSVAVLLFAGLGAAVWLWIERHDGAPPDALVLYGNVDVREVEVAFNGSERITRVMVQEGDRVTPGQLLASLDTQRLELEVARDEAQVAAQRQVVDRMEAGSRPEEIRKARADVEAAAAEARNLGRVDQRARALLAKRVASQQDADDAGAAADAARAKLQAAQAALALALAGPREEDKAAAKDTLRAYEAALALARRRLADAQLYAPAAGVIQNRILEVGDMASPQKPVFTLALTTPLWVRAYIDEPDIGKISPGMHAVVSTDSYPAKRYRAWIGFVSPTAEFTPKSVETREVRTRLVYEVRVFVCNPQDELRLGMPATVTIALDQPRAPVGTEGTDRCQGT
jgi:HlyD family secretion protein